MSPAPPPLPPPSLEELELEREMDYFVEPEDPVGSLDRLLNQKGSLPVTSLNPLDGRVDQG